MLLRTFGISVLIILCGYSCKQYKGIYREGRYHSVTRSWKYPSLVIPMKIAGTTTLVDTVDGRILEKTRFRTGAGVFNKVIRYERTITYDTNERRSKVLTVKGNKRKTVEYFQR